MNRFFDDLGERWVAAAGRRSAQIEAPTLDAELALELLELARVAARTQARRLAPLARYMAGVAAERLRTAKGGLDGAAVAALILAVRRELETEYALPTERWTARAGGSSA